MNISILIGDLIVVVYKQYATMSITYLSAKFHLYSANAWSLLFTKPKDLQVAC